MKIGGRGVGERKTYQKREEEEGFWLKDCGRISNIPMGGGLRCVREGVWRDKE